MNKVILGLILAVCVLGMALVMLNERLKPGEPPAITSNERQESEAGISATKTQVTGVADNSMTKVPVPEPGNVPMAPIIESEPVPPLNSMEMAESARVFEQNEARGALEPPFAPPPPIAHEPAAIPGAVTPPPASLEPAATDAITPGQPSSRPEATAAEPRPKAESTPKTEAAPKAEKTPQKPAEAKTANSGAKDASRTITNFVVFARDKGATVRLDGNGPLAYKHMTLENPDRVVIDLDNKWNIPQIPGIPKNDLVEHVRVGTQDGKTRIVIDLKDKPRLSRVVGAKNGNRIDVRVDK